MSASSKERHVGSLGIRSQKREDYSDRDLSKEPHLSGFQEGNKIRIGKLHSVKAGPGSLRNEPNGPLTNSKVEPKFYEVQEGAIGKESARPKTLEQQTENEESAMFGFSAKPLNSKAATDHHGRLKPKAFVQSISLVI